jgi:lipopolysaccharide biosynthesis glycosyltransferase
MRAVYSISATRWIFYAAVSISALLTIAGASFYLFQQTQDIEIPAPPSVLDFGRPFPVRHVNRSRMAIFTQFYSDDYFQGVITLAYSAKKQHSDVEFNIMYLAKQVDPKLVNDLRSLGYIMRAVDRVIPHKDPSYWRFKDQYTKLKLWTFTEYERVVYIDSDCVVVGDLTGLLDLTSDAQLAAVGDVWDEINGFDQNFNAGVLSLIPNETTYETILSYVDRSDLFNTEMAEQGLLNYLFGYQIYRLPYVYNMNLAMYHSTRWPLLRKVWNSLLPDARIIHYTIGKPFQVPENEFFQDTFQVWFQLNAEAKLQLETARE